jgi:hypothetical protein
MRYLLVLIFLTGCDLVRGSKEKEQIVYIRMKSEQCDLVMEKHFMIDASNAESGLAREAMQKQFMFDTNVDEEE